MARKQKKPNNEVDFDTHWKIFIEDDFGDFMAFAFKALHIAIDYQKGIEFIPQTLHKIIVGYGKKGRKTPDLMVKAFLKPNSSPTGKSEEIWILIHIEIEISPKIEFPARMFTYFYRALDKYGKKVIALAVFPGEKPQKVHKYYEWQEFGVKLRYDFNVLDVHEWSEAALLKEKSVVALALLASKRAVKTRGKYDTRYTYKKELLKLIQERNYPIEKAKRLLNFVFYILFLPKELDNKIVTIIFNENQEIMATTQLPARAKKRAEIFLELFIKNAFGLTLPEYYQKLADNEKEIARLNKAKVKAEQEKKNLIFNLSKIMSISQIAAVTKMSEKAVHIIIKEFRDSK